MTTVRTVRVLLLLLLASCSFGSPLDPGIKAVEEIRGRKFVRDVRNVTIDRSELASHLRKQMEATTPYSLDQWASILRSLYLVEVPAGEIVPKLLHLYEAQVLAFYDPQSATYYSIRQLPNLPPEALKLTDPKTLEETVMVHELTHALQDQHFRLAEREKALMRDTDANMAYHAVLEGEAVLVMVAHMLAKSGVSLDEVVADDTLISMITSTAQADQMITADTPRYFAEMVKFPYLEGLNFVIAAYRRGGWKELDRVHANPPRTTREILHPADYFERRFESRPLPLDKPKGAIAAERLGEFHWRFLVGAASATGLVGDRAVVWPDGRVAVETTWETAEQASTFARAYGAFLISRGLKQPAIAVDEASVSVSYKAAK